MSLLSVEDIEQAIDSLSPPQRQELFAWLERHPQPFDSRIEADIAAGRLDEAILQALDDERKQQTRPL